MSQDSKTVGFYDREATTYIKSVEPDNPIDKVAGFAKRLPSGGTVLDLGCGGGWASVAFRDLGFDVTAMDASSAMIASVAELGGIKTICSGFETIETVSVFDGIWASFCLQHTARENMPGVLGRLARALCADGWLYIGIHEGRETVRDNLDRLYEHYQEDELRGLLADSGIEIIKVNRGNSTGYDGRPIEHMEIEARKVG
ncbi:MAG: putative TPR repeat methyltransferase [Paracoccaceae bacterium]|jgi:predicted TPR repeat methyltransferase